MTSQEPTQTSLHLSSPENELLKQWEFVSLIDFFATLAQGKSMKREKFKSYAPLVFGFILAGIEVEFRLLLQLLVSIAEKGTAVIVFFLGAWAFDRFLERRRQKDPACRSEEHETTTISSGTRTERLLKMLDRAEAVLKNPDKTAAQHAAAERVRRAISSKLALEENRSTEE